MLDSLLIESGPPPNYIPNFLGANGPNQGESRTGRTRGCGDFNSNGKGVNRYKNRK
ncbi:hypothetical protein BRCON_1627 [Candidatus Sumerlaea chitinivorans]|uniref:Uncharacterized protein n=1 Tax=Sumerlaea chitinivorans TaxID=2250252 RepID=A0A2Z4Y5G4_SUMC1|nr:hypothetical protein BRCON_1627 [Candidatus Sumerlaea chitinivorans]